MIRSLSAFLYCHPSPEDVPLPQTSIPDVSRPRSASAPLPLHDHRIKITILHYVFFCPSSCLWFSARRFFSTPHFFIYRLQRRAWSSTLSVDIFLWCWIFWGPLKCVVFLFLALLRRVSLVRHVYPLSMFKDMLLHTSCSLLCLVYVLLIMLPFAYHQFAQEQTLSVSADIAIMHTSLSLVKNVKYSVICLCPIPE